MSILLPTESQVRSLNETKCAVSDYAIVLGAYVDGDYHIDGNNNLNGRTGYYYTMTPSSGGNARVVHHDGNIY